MTDFAEEDPFAEQAAGLARTGGPRSGRPAALPIFGPYRVLSIGSALLAKGGVTHHGRILSHAVERQLEAAAGHPFVVDAHFTEQSTLRTLELQIPWGELSNYDALILWLDQRSSKASAATAAHHMHRLIEDLWLRVVPGTTITVVLPPPSITGWPMGRATGLAIELRARVNKLIRVVELIDRHSDNEVALNYDSWVNQIAETVAGGLLDPLQELKPI